MTYKGLLSLNNNFYQPGEAKFVHKQSLSFLNMVFFSDLLLLILLIFKLIDFQFVLTDIFEFSYSEIIGKFRNFFIRIVVEAVLWFELNFNLVTINSFQLPVKFFPDQK